MEKLTWFQINTIDKGFAADELAAGQFVNKRRMRERGIENSESLCFGKIQCNASSSPLDLDCAEPWISFDQQPCKAVYSTTHSTFADQKIVCLYCSLVVSPACSHHLEWGHQVHGTSPRDGPREWWWCLCTISAFGNSLAQLKVCRQQPYLLTVFKTCTGKLDILASLFSHDPSTHGLQI